MFFKVSTIFVIQFVSQCYLLESRLQSSGWNAFLFPVPKLLCVSLNPSTSIVSCLSQMSALWGQGPCLIRFCEITSVFCSDLPMASHSKGVTWTGQSMTTQ